MNGGDVATGDDTLPNPADTQGLCPCGHRRCPCRRCHGTRWIEVSQNYADRLFPDPPAPTLADMAEGDAARAQVDYTAACAHQQERRAAAVKSCYPCRECAPAQFWRWVEGHYVAGHDPAGCDDCIEASGFKRRRRKRTGAPPEERERRDLE